MPYKPSMGCEVTTEADPNAIGAKIEVKGDTVMVTVRMRPFNKKEIEEKRGPCITLDYANRTVSDPLRIFPTIALTYFLCLPSCRQ